MHPCLFALWNPAGNHWIWNIQFSYSNRLQNLQEQRFWPFSLFIIPGNLIWQAKHSQKDEPVICGERNELVIFYFYICGWKHLVSVDYPYKCLTGHIKLYGPHIIAYTWMNTLPFPQLLMYQTVVNPKFSFTQSLLRWRSVPIPSLKKSN